MDERYVFYEARNHRPSSDNGMLIDFICHEGEEIWDMYSNNISNCCLLPMPYIFISDKIKRVSYGKYNTACISDMLEKLLDDMDIDRMGHRILDRIQVIFAKLDDVIMDENAKLDATTDRIVIMDEVYELEQQLKEEATPEELDLLEKIKDLFSNWKMNGDLLLGEYLADRHHVILYVDAIHLAADNDNVDFYEELSMTLAHELFHAFHHEREPMSALWKAGKSGGLNVDEKKIVKESLADYFSVYWSCIRSNAVTDVARKRIWSWASKYYTKWPYAKALCYLKDCKQNNWALPTNVDLIDIEHGLRLAMHVLMKSHSDLKEAYEII